MPFWSLGGDILWFYGLGDVPELETSLYNYFLTLPLWPFYNPLWAYGYKANADAYKAAIKAVLKLFRFDLFFGSIKGWMN